MTEFIWFILIGAVAGFLAGKIMKGGGFGLIFNLILGVVGGVLGGWIFGELGISVPVIKDPLIARLIVSTIGAIIVLWVASLFRK